MCSDKTRSVTPAVCDATEPMQLQEPGIRRVYMYEMTAGHNVSVLYWILPPAAS